MMLYICIISQKVKQLANVCGISHCIISSIKTDHDICKLIVNGPITDLVGEQCFE